MDKHPDEPFQPLSDGTIYHTVIAEGHMIHVNPRALVVLALGAEEGDFYALSWADMIPLMKDAYKRHKDQEAAVAKALAASGVTPRDRSA